MLIPKNGFQTIQSLRKKGCISKTIVSFLSFRFTIISFFTLHPFLYNVKQNLNNISFIFIILLAKEIFYTISILNK